MNSEWKWPYGTIMCILTAPWLSASATYEWTAGNRGVSIRLWFLALASLFVAIVSVYGLWKCMLSAENILKTLKGERP